MVRSKHKKYLNRFITFYIPVGVAVIVFIIAALAFSFVTNKSVLGVTAYSYIGSVFAPLTEPHYARQSFEFVEKYLDEQKGSYSLYIKNLNSGSVYTYGDGNVFYAASLYKVPVAVSTLLYLRETGNDLNTEITLLSSDISSGTGVLTKYPAGTKLTYREILHTLLSYSDNTSQTMLLRTIPAEYLSRGFTLDGTNDWGKEFFKSNSSNAYGYGIYLEKIFITEFLTVEELDVLYAGLYKTAFEDRIATHLDSRIKFYHKIGSWGNPVNWHDCGFITSPNNDYIVCLMSQSAPWDEYLETSKIVAEYLNSVVL